MMIFDDLINGDEKKAFVHSLQEGRLLHAYIIEGAAGAGKRSFAVYAAAAILCTDDNKPCGKCLPCKKIIAGTHPDVTLTIPEKSNFSVDNIRSIKKSLFLTANESDKKIYILADAEKMMAAAQNAMLKFLEEPPDTAVLFILVPSRDVLLPTVVSRCNPITLYPSDDEKLRLLLKKNKPKLTGEEIEKAIAAASGLPGAALEYYDKQQIADRRLVTDICRAMFEPGIFNFSLLMSGSSDRGEVRRRLLILLKAMADIMRVKRKSGRPLLLEYEDARTFSLAVTEKKLSAICNTILETYEAIDINTNISLTLTALSDGIRRIKR